MNTSINIINQLPRRGKGTCAYFRKFFVGPVFSCVVSEGVVSIGPFKF